MKAIKSITLAGMLAAAAPPADAQEILSFDLDGVVEYALQHSTQSRAADLQAAEDRTVAYSAITEGLPRISSKVEYTNNFDLPTTVITSEGMSTEFQFGTPHNAEVAIEGSQLLVDGRYFVGLKARKTIIAGAGHRREMGRTDIKEAVTNAYYAALSRQEIEILLARNLETTKTLLEETRLLYESGFAEEIDVDRLELIVSRLNSAGRTSEKNTLNAMNLLKFNMGIKLNEDILLTDSLFNLVEGMRIPELVFGNPENRPEYRAMMSLKRLRQFDIQQKRMGYFPSLSAFASYGFSAQRDRFNFFADETWFRDGRFGITLNVPIFDGLVRDASIQGTKVKHEMSKNDIAAFQESMRLETAVAYTDYISSHEQMSDQQRNVALAEKIYNKTKIMYKEGVGSSLDMSQAYTDFVNTQVDYINAVLSVMTNMTRLDKALGNL